MKRERIRKEFSKQSDEFLGRALEVTRSELENETDSETISLKRRIVRTIKDILLWRANG